MAAKNLDGLHHQRVESIMNGDDGVNLSDLFVSEKVFETISSEKILFDGYETKKVLAALPFTPVVYVSVCPYCVKEHEFEDFRKLVTSDSIVPILMARYDSFPDRILDTVVGRHHISMYEYSAFRYLSIAGTSPNMLCEHCTRKQFDRMRSSVRRIKARSDFESGVSQIGRNAFPYVDPDFTLLKQAEAACKARDLDRLNELVSLSFGLRQFRDAQAFHSSVIMSEEDVSLIPTGVSTEADDSLQMMARFRVMAAKGLGITFPADISVDRYVEIANDYRPEISKIVSDVASAISTDNGSVDRLSRKMSKLNSEIERIKG